MLFYVLGLSMTSKHQEYRFLLPCLPYIHILVGYTIYQIITNNNNNSNNNNNNNKDQCDSSNRNNNKLLNTLHSGASVHSYNSTHISVIGYLCILLVFIQIIPTFYLIRYHQVNR